VALENERIHEQVERLGIDREMFEREALKLKGEAERDQADSEKIGFFKANKERLRDDLRILKEDLETERETLREDRIRLEMHKNELRTRQKTLEQMRFEYVSSHQRCEPLPGAARGAAQVIQEGSAEGAKELGYQKIIQRYSAGPAFYPISSPQFQRSPAKQGGGSRLSPNRAAGSAAEYQGKLD
jgi:hypothetical protein